jgi:cold shock protein
LSKKCGILRFAVSEQGEVKFFNRELGFGFITRPDGSDVFVHISNTDNPIFEQGERVSFDIGQNSRTGKLEAKKVETSNGA